MQLSHTLQNRTAHLEQNRVGCFQSQTPEHVKVTNGHPKGKPWNLPPAKFEHLQALAVDYVSMQKLYTTITVTPKGTVDYWTVFMLIMETQISKLTRIL
jgi:hypothetical protein